MASENSVKITIDVVDANSGAVVSTVTKNLTELGNAGTQAGAQVTTGAQQGSAALKGTGDAGVATGRSIMDAMTGAAGSIDQVTAAGTRAQQSMVDIGAGIEASAAKTRRASGEMTQMLENIHRAQLKMNASAGAQTNSWHGPMRKQSNDLGENFINAAFGANERLGQSFADMPKKVQAAENATKKFGASTAGHSTTALDRVRLLSQEFGLRLPRALETMLSRMPMVMGAIGALGGAVAGLAIAEVFIRAGTAIYDLEQKFVSIDAPAKAFYETMLKTSKLDFSNTRNIETTQLRKGMAERDSAQLPKNAALEQAQGLSEIAKFAAFGMLGGNPVYGVQQVRHAQQTATRGAEADDNTMKLTAADVEQTHKQVLDQIELNHHLDDTLERRKQITAATRKASELATEKTRYDRKMEMAQGNPAPGNAGAAEVRMAQQTADADAAKQTIALNQEVSAAVQKARNAASQAGMQGEALYYRKQKDAVAELRSELVAQHLAEEIPARTIALNLQYDNERLARARDLTAETKRATAEAASAGLTGIARLEADRSAGLSGVDAAKAKFSGGAQLSPEADAAFAQQKVNVNARTNQQIEEQQRQFTDRIHDLDAARSDSTLSFNQRTDAATRRAQQEITKAWEEMYGKLGALDQRRVQSYQALQAELGRMGAEGTREKQANRATLEDETGKLEDEAGRRGMSREREAQQAVLDEYRERYNRLEELRAKDADNADLYRRQEIAAEEEKNGKLLEQQRALRDKLAGQLRGLFSNPIEAMKKMGEDAASKYAADLVLKATNKTSTPTGDAGTVHAGKLAELLGIGGGGTRLHAGARKGEAAPPPTHTVATHSAVSAASTTLTTGSATITITGQAVFAGGAGSTSFAAGSKATGNVGAASSTAAANLGGLSLPASISSPDASIGDAGAASSDAASAAADPGSTQSSSSVQTSTGNAGASYGMLAPTPSWTGDSGTGSAGAGGLLSTVGSAKGMGKDVQTLIKGFPGGDDALKALGTKAQKMTGMSTETLGKIGGAAGGAMGVYSAAESNGGVGSALSGAVSGMQVGAIVGGPVGAAVGAAAGAILGFIGFGGSAKAGEYYTKEVQPRISSDLTEYGMGSKDYQSAYDDLVALDKEAREKTKALGMGGKREWDGHIHPEIMSAQKQLDREQKAGRSQYGMTAAQFHNGGLIGDFGSMGTTGDQGWIHAQQGEFMMHQQAVPSHYQALQLMQSGASHSDMANYYGGSGSGTTAPAPAATELHMNFHAPDANSAYNLFMDNKHHVRSALNSSYAENSGGADAGD